ncbi:hypothetical protein DNU54_27455, partial [Salmonella enterica subsp. enterica serovar Ajiobo]|nr:hypothetical protein [Salmonella enterica subsp. enterica serovar Ajiobo]
IQITVNCQSINKHKTNKKNNKKHWQRESTSVIIKLNYLFEVFKVRALPYLSRLNTLLSLYNQK